MDPAFITQILDTGKYRTCNYKCDHQMNDDGTVYCYTHDRLLDEDGNEISQATTERWASAGFEDGQREDSV